MSTIKLKKTPCIIALVIIGFFAVIQVYLYNNKWVALAYLCFSLYTIYFFKKYSIKFKKIKMHHIDKSEHDNKKDPEVDCF